MTTPRKPDPLAKYVVGSQPDPLAQYVAGGGYPQPGAVAGSMAHIGFGPASNWLPTGGGLGGSLLGGAIGAPFFPPLGAMAGSAIGGFAGGYGGDAGRRALVGQPQSAQGSSIEGGKQAVWGLLGEAPAAILGIGGRALRLAAARISPQMAERFPGLIENYLASRLGINPAGAAKAEAGRAAAAATERSILRRAGKAGVRVPNDPMAQALDQLSAEMGAQPVSAADQAGVAGFKDEFLAKRPNGMNPLQAKKMIQKADQATGAAKNARAAGNLVGAEQSTSAAANEAVGNSARKWLRENVPGWHDAAAKTRDAIGLARVLKRATNPAFMNRSVPVPVVPGFVSHYLWPQALRTPPVVSGLGMMATDPALQAALRQSPRLLGGLLMPPPPDTTR